MYISKAFWLDFTLISVLFFIFLKSEIQDVRSKMAGNDVICFYNVKTYKKRYNLRANEFRGRTNFERGVLLTLPRSGTTTCTTLGYELACTSEG